MLFLLFLSLLLLLHSVCRFEGSSVFAGVFCFSDCLLAFLLCLLRHFPSIHSRVAYAAGNLISRSVFVWLSRLVVTARSFFLSCCCSVAIDQQPVSLEFVLLWRQCLSAVRSEQQQQE